METPTETPTEMPTDTPADTPIDTPPEPAPEPPAPPEPAPAPEPAPEPPAPPEPAPEPPSMRLKAPQQSTTPVAFRPRSKLVSTIGPATADRTRELVAAGMDVARVNFSHGTLAEHKQAIDAVRAAAHHARRSVAVMVDLPGPKIRLGELDDDEVELQVGHSFTLRQPGGAEGAGTANGADVSRPDLAQLVQDGDRILLADGAAELRVNGAGTMGGSVETTVVRGGTVRSRSGVNIPSERLPGGALTDEDREAIPRIVNLRADMVAQSFVRSAADVDELRSQLPPDNGPLLVAKIETRAAVDNFDEIVAAADGVMVARGDLGVDLPFEDLPLIQKDLLRRARAQGRFTIVATQMLESMTAAPRPTRAEASDVANAVLDGADAVMLSAETAIGAFPIEAAQAMARICSATERRGADFLPRYDPAPGASAAEAVVDAAAYLSAIGQPGGNGPSAIWCFTRSGRTARLLSVLRPRVPIVAFTTTPLVARQLAVRNAVVPVILSAARTGEPLIQRMEAAARAQRVVGSDGPVSVLLVTTSAQAGGVNRLELHEV
jgi:pyruvate kinase